MARYKLEQAVQREVAIMARVEGVPAGLGRCSVQLVYRPRDNRRRDTDNLVATLKPVCDGLVAVGVVPDDIPRFMDKPQPIIEPAGPPPNHDDPRARMMGRSRRLWVVLTEVSS